MEEKMTVSFRVLLLLNSIPFLVSLIDGMLGSSISMAAIILQLILVWENYYFTDSIKKMLLLDLISFLLAAGGNIVSGMWYASSGEVRDVYENWQQFCVRMILWMGGIALFVLGILIREFSMREKQKAMGLAVMLEAAVCVLFVWYLACTLSPANPDYLYVELGGPQEAASYGGKEGVIFGEEKKDGFEYGVLIRDSDGNEISKISEEELGICPEFIALGPEHYYVGGGDYDEQDYAISVLVQLNYQSEVLSKRSCDEMESLVYRDGYLFFVKDGESNVMDNFGTDEYLKESEFEKGRIMECEADADGICRVGSMVLHGSRDGFYYLNPELDDYSGTEDIEFYKGEKLEGERTKWTDAVMKMLDQKGVKAGEHCMIKEYQKGTEIYGTVNICNRFHWGFPGLTYRSVIYRMSKERPEPEIIKELDKKCILYTGTHVIFKEGSALACEDVKSGKHQKLAETRMNSFDIAGEYISFYTDNEREEKIRIPQ